MKLWTVFQADYDTQFKWLDQEQALLNSLNPKRDPRKLMVCSAASDIDYCFLDPGETTPEKVRNRENNCQVGAREEWPQDGSLTGSRAPKLEFRF